MIYHDLSRDLHGRLSAVEEQSDFSLLLSQWVDSLPDAALVVSTSGEVVLTNARMGVLFERMTGCRTDARALMRRSAAEVLFDITASLRAIDFVSQALAAMDRPIRQASFARSDESASQQDIQIANVKRGRALRIKYAVIAASCERSRALIFHVAEVSPFTDFDRGRERALRFLSHDMRSPQASILALVEQMRQQQPRMGTERFTELVAQYATKALGLIDNFLFLARAETLPCRMEPLDPALLLGEAVDDMWPQASARFVAIDLIAEPGGTLIADAGLLRRAFSNLIDNAVKFSPKGSVVDVRLSGAADHFRVSVADRGPGISEFGISRLFREFTRLDERLSRPGHGLGLAFAKTVVDSLGGNVEVRSKLGEGATFIVTLPKIESDQRATRCAS